MLRYFSRRRYLLLLVSLLLLFVIQPFVPVRDRVVIASIWSAVLVSGVWGVRRSRWFLIVALGLAMPALAANWAFHFLGSRWLAVTGLGLATAFLGFTTLTIVVGVVRDDTEVTADTIAGAICGYLLLGLIWALIFSLMELVQPGSFSLAAGQQGEQLATRRMLLPELVYYSLVTVTTLGYGDIRPLTSPAQAFAALEAVTGQLYLAVLIARLVGLHTNRSSRRS